MALKPSVEYYEYDWTKDTYMSDKLLVTRIEREFAPYVGKYKIIEECTYGDSPSDYVNMHYRLKTMQDENDKIAEINELIELNNALVKCKTNKMLWAQVIRLYTENNKKIKEYKLKQISSMEWVKNAKTGLWEHVKPNLTQFEQYYIMFWFRCPEQRQRAKL